MTTTTQLLETRDDSGGDPGEHDDQDGIAEVRAAVEGFTSTIETRLGAIDATLAELGTFRQRTETVLRRPAPRQAAAETREEAAALERRAFSSFIRRGREGMPAEEVRVLQVAVDTAGGYLAPDDFIAELDRNLVQFSPIRSIARVRQTSNNAVVLPKRLTGLTAQWIGELGPVPETTLTFGESRYAVNMISCFVDVSNTLLEDAAVDIASELSFAFAEEFGRLEGAAFVAGPAASALIPTGFMSDPTILSVHLALHPPSTLMPCLICSDLCCLCIGQMLHGG